MEEDTQRQAAKIQHVLVNAKSIMSSASSSGSDELRISTVLQMYPDMQMAARMWASAFQQTSQLLQAGAVLRHSAEVPQLLGQGIQILRMMEVAHHSLSIGSPSMGTAIRADEAELRRLLSQLPKETFSGPVQELINVSAFYKLKLERLSCWLATQQRLTS